MKFKCIKIALLLLVLFTSCDEDDFEKTWISTGVTQCANGWDDLGLSSMESNVTKYLSRNDVHIYDYKEEVVSLGPFCTACDCPSGKIIKVLIKDSDIEKMKVLGFYE